VAGEESLESSPGDPVLRSAIGSELAAGAGDALGDLFRLALAIVLGLYLGSWIIAYWLWVPILLGIAVWLPFRLARYVRERKRRAAEPRYIFPTPPGVVHPMPMPMALRSPRPSGRDPADPVPARPRAGARSASDGTGEPPRTELRSPTRGETALREESGSASSGTSTQPSVSWEGWVWRERRRWGPPRPDDTEAGDG
jgi:hypothetical protein